MISFEEIKEVNNERIIRAYGFNYERFLSLPKDFQIAIISKFFDENYIESGKKDDIKEKIKILLKRNK